MVAKVQAALKAVEETTPPHDSIGAREVLRRDFEGENETYLDDCAELDHIICKARR